MDERLELLRRAYETFNDGDVDYALFHPKIRIVQSSKLLGTAGEFAGYDGMRRAAEELNEGWDEIRMEPEDYTELEDGRMLVLCRFTARGTRSEIQLNAPVWHLWTFRDGLLARMEIYASRRKALEAVAAGQPS